MATYGPTQPMGATATSPFQGLMSPSNTIMGTQIGMNNQTNGSTPAYASGGYNLGASWNAGKPTYNPIIPSSGMLSTTSPSNTGIMTPPPASKSATVLPAKTGSTTPPPPPPPAAQGTPVPPAGTPAYLAAQKAGTSYNGTTGVITNAPAAPAAPVVPDTYTQSTQNLANTQTPPATTAAVGTSQGIANNQGTSAPAGTPGAYANTATTGLLGMSQNQTPAVVQAEQNVADFNATNPLMRSQQSALPMAAEISSGRGQILGNTLANTSQGLANTLNAAIQGEGQQITAGNEAGALANTTQGQQLTGANQAGTMANTAQSNQINAQSNAGNLSQPTQLPYGTQYGTPQQLMNGQGQGQGGNLSPQNTASNYAAQVIAGTKSYNDAKSAMGYAGSAGQAMLDQAIQQQKPGFNVNQAQVNSATQGALAPQGSVATGELNNLQTSMEQMTNVMGFLPQNTSIPVINGFTRWVGGLVGNASTQNLNDAASAARSAVATALGTAYNTTPTDFTGQVNAWFPQGASTAQIQQGVDSFNALMKVRQASFSSPGTASFTPAGTSGTTGTWPGWNP